MTQRQLVYIGTYTEMDPDQPPRADGIYIYDFDSATGTFDLRNTVKDVANPSFLTLSKDGQHLFAVNELGEFAGTEGGGTSAFSVNEASQASFINAQPTHGTYPCYINLDATEKWALVANYGGGNITVFPVAPDRSLGEASSVIQNHGQTGPRQEQDTPHAHSVVFDQTQRFAFVADLGLDQIFIFRFDAATGQLMPNDPPYIATASGAGPRHLEFHPNGRYLYVTNELDSTVSVYDYDAEQGKLTHKQTLSSLPADFTGKNSMADIHISRDGLFLYASNRGHDSIVLYAVDPASGQLSFIETVSSGGKKPRNFALDLNDKFLVVAHQDSNDVYVFHRDSNTGRLTKTDTVLSIPSPVYVRFVAGGV